MTQQPPVPDRATETRVRAAIAKNLTGLAAMVAGLVGLAVMAFLVDARLGGAVLCVGAIAGGYVLATSEA